MYIWQYIALQYIFRPERFTKKSQGKLQVKFEIREGIHNTHHTHPNHCDPLSGRVTHHHT